MLVKALKNTATTPLRNRITVGKRLLSPLWSNLMGPLLALDAEVEVVGKLNGTHKYEDLLSKGRVSRKRNKGSKVFDKISSITLIDLLALQRITQLSPLLSLWRLKKMLLTARRSSSRVVKIYERLNQAEAKVIGKKLKELTRGTSSKT